MLQNFKELFLLKISTPFLIKMLTVELLRFKHAFKSNQI